MLILFLIVLVIFSKPLSSSNNLYASSVQYPHVAPSPFVSHDRKSATSFAGSGKSALIQEKECFVARLCEYKIHENFSCKISEYVISKGFERTIPKWLWFDEENLTLKGIPSPADEGLSEILIIGLSRQDSLVGHICGLLTVKIVVWNLKHLPLFAQNLPTSPIINDKFLRASTWQSDTCQFNEPIVLATLVLPGNFHQMNGKRKINLLDELLQIYHISMYDVFVMSNYEKDSLAALLQSSHVLASGPGANRSASGTSTTISWHVTCGVIRLDDPLFHVMEKLSQQTVFINNVGYAPIGWYVITGFQKHHVRRRRNIVVGTTTPAYTTIPISRATVITTRIKTKRTMYVSPTATFTWTRPFPKFSSPFATSKTSLYSKPLTVSSQFNNKTIPSQYKSVSSTVPAMSQSRHVSSISQISPSRPQASEISQYGRVSSTMSVMSQSRNISSISQVLSSRQQASDISQYGSASSTLSVMSQSRNISSISQISPSRQQTSRIYQYKSVSSTMSLMSQSRTVTSKPQISPSRKQTSEIYQYQSVSSTMSVMYQSRTVISKPQISPSRKQTSEISKSTNTSSQIHPASEITRLDNMSVSSQLPSSNFSTFFRPSLTASQKKSSKYMILPSSRSFRYKSSVQPAIQSVINNTNFSLTIVDISSDISSSDISSLFISNMFSTEPYPTSTSKVQLRVLNTTTIMMTTPPNNSTTSFLLPSYSNFIDSVSSSSSRRYSFAVSSSGIINETESTPVSQTSYEVLSPITHTRSIPSLMATNIAETTPQSYTLDRGYTSFSTSTLTRSSIQRSNPSPSSPPSMYSSVISSLSKNVNMTPTSRYEQHTPHPESSIVSRTPYLASSIVSIETMFNGSSTTGTLVLLTDTTLATPQTTVVDKTVKSTSPMLTAGKDSKSFQSSEYNISKVIRPTTTMNRLGTSYTSRFGTRSKGTIQASSSGGMSTEVSSGSRKEARLSSTTLVKPTSTGKTLVTAASQSRSKSFMSSVLSATVTSTAIVSMPIEQIKSTYSSLIKTSVQTKTIQAGSLVSTVVPNPSTSFLFTSHISMAASSSILRSYFGHRSVSASLILSTKQSGIQSETTLTSFPHIVSISSQRDSPIKSSSNQIFEKSSSLVVMITPSSVFLSSYHKTSSSSTVTTLPSSTVTTLPSSVFLSLYRTFTLISSNVMITVASSVFLSFYHTASSPYTATTRLPATAIPLSVFQSSSQRLPTQKSIVVSATPSSDSLPSSYNTSTSPLTIVTTTPSISLLSSHHTPTLLLTVFSTFISSDFLSSTFHTPSSVVAITSLSSSQHTPTSSSVVLSANPSTVILSSSYHTPSLLISNVFTTITSSDFFSSYHASYTSNNVTTTPISDFLPSSQHTPTLSSVVLSTTPSTVILSSYHTPSLLISNVTTTTLSDFFSSYHASSTSNDVTTTPISDFLPSSQHTPTSSSVALSVNPSTVILSSYHTLSLLISNVVTTITSSDFLLSSHHTSISTDVTTTPIQDVLSSPHTPTPSSIVLNTTPYHTSHHAPTTPLSVVTSGILASQHTFRTSTVVTTTRLSSFVSSSYHTIMTTLGNQQTSTSTSSASYKTLSLSFLSSSIVTSQLSISFDLSTMVHPATESSIFEWSSLTNASRLHRPSYTSRHSPRTTTIPLTRTSTLKMPVTTSSGELFPSSTSTKSSSSAVTPPTTPSKDSPKIYNNFDLLRVSVGKVFKVQIPVDTFHDREDGNTRSLRLECLTVNHGRLSSDSWLQFNSTSQTLYGLVLKSQLEEIGTSSEYFLTASDRDGNTVYDAFTVDIEDREKHLAAMFSVKLVGTNLEIFGRSLGNVLSLVETIAGYYGDKDESSIQVLSLTKGSVIFSWSNTSLQTCNKDLINELERKIITREGDVEPYFYNALSPRFITGDVFVNYTGPCIIHTTANPAASELSSHQTSPWLQYVLPALGVALVVVVIAVVCLLVRRHSGVKVLKEDERIFKRRKPIILDDELDMSTLSGKPIELPEDSLTPVRFPRETSLGTPDYNEWSSPMLSAPSYQRLPPHYSGISSRNNTPPPPYKLPPSY